MRFILLFSLFISGSLFAQIPNPGFENWVVGNWLLEPAGWSTPNDQFNTVVSQDAYAFEGEFAMHVEAVPDGIGEYGWAECTVPIDYIPPSLDFYVKSWVAFGGVSVVISFYNNDFLFNSFEWNSGSSIEEWTLVSIEMEQNEPVLTHATIRVEAQVGDLVPGDAAISIDAMGFDGPLSNDDVVIDSNFGFYPNPTNSHITLSGVTTPSNVRITNIAGQMIFETNTTSNQRRLDLSGLPKGLYIVTIQNENQVRTSKKLVMK